MSYWGIRPDGKRFYVESKRRVPLAFAVLVFYDPRATDETRASSRARWYRVALIEDRPHKNERHRVGGSYVPYEGEMPPRVLAEVKADWWHEIARIPAERIAIVPLSEAFGGRGRIG